MMPDPIVHDQIEALARALFATITPITGERATGAITVTALGAPGDAPVPLPKNTYLRAIIGGQLREEMLFKTTAEGWAVPAGESEAGVPITSNVGGARHNLPAGTTLRFHPLVPGLAPTATLDADLTGGSGAGALLRSLAFFEDLDATNTGDDIFAAQLTTPAVMLVWQYSEPLEGSPAGSQQGTTRRARNVKAFHEYFVAYVVVSRLSSDAARREQGLLSAQAISRLLTDRKQNDDGEQLSTIGGGVEILGRSRYRREENRLIYAVRFRLNQTLEGTGARRVYSPWDLTRTRGLVPPGAEPEPAEDLETVDVTDPMP